MTSEPKSDVEWRDRLRLFAVDRDGRQAVLPPERPDEEIGELLACVWNPAVPSEVLVVEAVALAGRGSWRPPYQDEELAEGAKDAALSVRRRD